jgi:hypothetical protein
MDKETHAMYDPEYMDGYNQRWNPRNHTVQPNDVKESVTVRDLIRDLENKKDDIENLRNDCDQVVDELDRAIDALNELDTDLIERLAKVASNY